MTRQLMFRFGGALAVAVVVGGCGGSARTAAPTTTTNQIATNATTAPVVTTPVDATRVDKLAWDRAYGSDVTNVARRFGELADTMGESSPPDPGGVETTCNLLVRQVDLARSHLPIPDQRANGAYLTALSVVQPYYDGCQRSPRTAGGLPGDRAVHDSVIYAQDLSEISAALTAP